MCAFFKAKVCDENKTENLWTQDTARNFLLVEGKNSFARRIILNAFCRQAKLLSISVPQQQQKINLWRLRKPSLTLTDQKFYYFKFYFIFTAKNKAFSKRRNFLYFTLCPSYIAVQVSRSHINEKSQLAQSTSDNN